MVFVSQGLLCTVEQDIYVVHVSCQFVVHMPVFMSTAIAVSCKAGHMCKGYNIVGRHVLASRQHRVILYVHTVCSFSTVQSPDYSCTKFKLRLLNDSRLNDRGVSEDDQKVQCI